MSKESLSYLRKEIRDSNRENNRQLKERVIEPLTHARHRDMLTFFSRLLDVAFLMEREAKKGGKNGN